MKRAAAVFVALGLIVSVVHGSTLAASASPDEVSGVECKANFNTTNFGSFTRGFWLRCNYGGTGLTNVVVGCDSSGGPTHLVPMTADADGGAVAAAMFYVAGCAFSGTGQVYGVNSLPDNADPDCGETDWSGGCYWAVSWAITGTSEYPVSEPAGYGSTVGDGDAYDGDGVCPPSLALTRAQMAAIAIDVGVQQDLIARLIAYAYPVTGGLVGWLHPLGAASGVGPFNAPPTSLEEIFVERQQEDPWMSGSAAVYVIFQAQRAGTFEFRHWRFNGYPPDADELELAEEALADPDFSTADACTAGGGTGDSPWGDPEGGGTPCASDQVYTLAEMAFALQNVPENTLSAADEAEMLALLFAATDGQSAFVYEPDDLPSGSYRSVFAVLYFGGEPTANAYTEAARAIALRDQATSMDETWDLVIAEWGDDVDLGAAEAALASPTVPPCGVPADGRGGINPGGDGGSCSMIDIGCHLQRLFDSLFGIIVRALRAVFEPSPAAVQRLWDAVSELSDVEPLRSLSELMEWTSNLAGIFPSMGGGEGLEGYSFGAGESCVELMPAGGLVTEGLDLCAERSRFEPWRTIMGAVLLLFYGSSLFMYYQEKVTRK